MKGALIVFFGMMLAILVVGSRNSYAAEQACNAAGGHPYPGNGWFNYQTCIFGKDLRWTR